MLKEEKISLKSKCIFKGYEGCIKCLPIELDFVYGSIIIDTFQPLDGQQRLTTLFLFHWYFALKEECNYKLFKNILNKIILKRQFYRILLRNFLGKGKTLKKF